MVVLNKTHSVRTIVDHEKIGREGARDGAREGARDRPDGCEPIELIAQSKQ